MYDYDGETRCKSCGEIEPINCICEPEKTICSNCGNDSVNGEVCGICKELKRSLEWELGAGKSRNLYR